MRFSMKKTVVTVCTLIVLALLWTNHSPSLFDPARLSFAGLNSRVQTTRKLEVKQAFQHAWRGYSTFCFGHDTLHPVSNTCEDDFGGWGATAIDSLTTAILFKEEEAVIQILEFIASLDLRHLPRGTKLQVFEVIIRHLGAMISAWDLLHGPFSSLATDRALRRSLYEQMVVLGDVLSHAFDSPSGLPHDWVDPTTGKTDEGKEGTLAGAGTVILEFARLSAITGNDSYVAIARRAEEHLLSPTPAAGEPFPGLLGSWVELATGKIKGARGSWGAMADSFYEYLIKAYIYDSKTYSTYLERWLVAADSTIQSISSHPFGHPEWTLLSTWDEQKTTNSMESLSWFAGGNFILGGMVTKNKTLVNFGLSIADTAGAVYNMTTTGLGGEFVTWSPNCADADSSCDKDSSLRIADGKFRLRPEVLETWYYAYRATRNPRYREWSWAAFQAINTYCRTDSGFSAISNVNADDGGQKTDLQETFVFAEVLKYIYLIQLEDHDAPYHVQDSRTGAKNMWVYNTEAHPFMVTGGAV